MTVSNWKHFVAISTNRCEEFTNDAVFVPKLRHAIRFQKNRAALPRGPKTMSTEVEERSNSDSAGLAKFVLAAILIIAIPVFIRTPLTTDTIYYDLQARHLVEGGQLYEDMFEPNLPGVIWLHVAVRSIAGDSWEALRVFDLLMFSAAVFIAVRWIVPRETTKRSRYYIAAACYLFYFSQTTWCHCQRDVWMLVPVLGAMALRIRQVERIRGDDARGSTIFGLGILEGMVWGVGVWLKPHAILMAGAIWLLGVVATRRWQRIAVDTCGLVLGGLVVGGAGIAWMVTNGCWPAFWDTMTQWNPEYATHGQVHKTLFRYIQMAYFMAPWVWLHVLALPLAIIHIRRHFGSDLNKADTRKAMLAGCYLAWTFQAFVLQHLFHYVHVGPIILGVLVILSSVPNPLTSPVRLSLVGFAAFALLCSPLLRMERLAVWWPCIKAPASLDLADRLSGNTGKCQLGDIAKVAEFLVDHQIRRQDVWCYNSELVALYDRLKLTPPTRFVYTLELLVFMPSRRQEIWQAHRERPIRYLVANPKVSMLTPEQIQQLKEQARGLQTGMATDNSKNPLPFPWNAPVVYTAGNYYVFDLDAKPQTFVSDRQVAASTK